MINFNIKTLFNKSKPEETSVSITPEVEESDKAKEVFDNAVTKVVKATLKDKINKELFILVYGQECFDQTTAAIKERSYDIKTHALVEKYPKVKLSGDFLGEVYPCLRIQQDDVIKYLTDLAYDQVYGETLGGNSDGNN